MCDWDDAFVADCSNAKKAAEIAQLAELGYQEHGRGALLWHVLLPVVQHCRLPAMSQAAVHKQPYTAP